MNFNRKNLESALEWLNEIDRLKSVVKRNAFHNSHSCEYISYLKGYIKKLEIGFRYKFGINNTKPKRNCAYYFKNTKHINESIENVDIFLLLIEKHLLIKNSENDLNDLITLLEDDIKNYKSKPIFVVGFPTSVFKNSKVLEPINKVISGYWNTKEIYNIEKILGNYIFKHNILGNYKL